MRDDKLPQNHKPKEECIMVDIIAAQQEIGKFFYENGFRGYKCVIMVLTTMPSTVKEIKTGKRDALKIAKRLAYRTYSPVYVPTEQDNAIKEYIWMRDDAQSMLKQTKQQINALCLRHGKILEGKSRWTTKHMQWPRSTRSGNAIVRETFSGIWPVGKSCVKSRHTTVITACRMSPSTTPPM